jgi:hypothetical protein
LQPEHEEQQSAEAQQPVCVALAVPVVPSAITAINNATFNVFIVFSFRSGKSLRRTDGNIRAKKPAAARDF